jgi:hypothetical protein
MREEHIIARRYNLLFLHTSHQIQKATTFQAFAELIFRRVFPYSPRPAFKQPLRICWGGAADLAPVITELQAAGAASLRAIADGSNQRGIPTARGNAVWSATLVMRVMARAG